MNGKQHVCLITPGFPKDEQDDTCMPYLQTYLKESVAQNNQIEFSVISLQYPYSNKPYFWHGIPVFPCGGKNRPFPTRVFYWIRAFRQLSAIDQRKKIDVVHSLWLTECSYLGQWWTRFSHIPHIATAMGQDVLPKNRYLRILNFERLQVVTVSSRQQTLLASFIGSVRSKVIPWGMDQLPNAENQRNIDVLGVGSLTELKRFDLFLRTVFEVVKTNPELRVCLIGDGPKKTELQNLISLWNLDKNVRFAGQMARSEVLEYMKRSKVLLHTSQFESQGYVFNEATACGMGIVSTSVGSAASSPCWIVANDERELAKGVNDMLNGSVEAHSLCPVNDTIERYHQLYQDIER